MGTGFNNIARVNRSTEQARSNYNRLSKWYDLLTASEKQMNLWGLPVALVTGQKE